MKTLRNCFLPYLPLWWGQQVLGQLGICLITHHLIQNVEILWIKAQHWCIQSHSTKLLSYRYHHLLGIISVSCVIEFLQCLHAQKYLHLLLPFEWNSGPNRFFSPSSLSFSQFCYVAKGKFFITALKYLEGIYSSPHVWSTSLTAVRAETTLNFDQSDSCLPEIPRVTLWATFTLWANLNKTEWRAMLLMPPSEIWGLRCDNKLNRAASHFLLCSCSWAQWRGQAIRHWCWDTSLSCSAVSVMFGIWSFVKLPLKILTEWTVKNCLWTVHPRRTSSGDACKRLFRAFLCPTQNLHTSKGKCSVIDYIPREKGASVKVVAWSGALVNEKKKIQGTVIISQNK